MEFLALGPVSISIQVIAILTCICLLVLGPVSMNIQAIAILTFICLCLDIKIRGSPDIESGQLGPNEIKQCCSPP